LRAELQWLNEQERKAKPKRFARRERKAMIEVSLWVMGTVMLLLVCGSCATESGIRYGSNIELEAGSDRGKKSKTMIDGAGLFFSGEFGRIELGQDARLENVTSGAG
jgi:hypothetical protein